MQKAFMSLVLGAALATVAVGPSIAGQGNFEQEDMHKQQLGRAKKALQDALVAIQASGNWNAGGDQHAAEKGVETAITEVNKESSRVVDQMHHKK
jgi:hypothetical protein